MHIVKMNIFINLLFSLCSAMDKPSIKSECLIPPKLTTGQPSTALKFQTLVKDQHEQIICLKEICKNQGLLIERLIEKNSYLIRLMGYIQNNPTVYVPLIPFESYTNEQDLHEK